MIEELSHRTPDATIKTRCQSILLSAKPMSVPQIAQVIFYSEDTVARCIHEFHQSRLESLLPSPKGGRPPKVTPGYLKQLLSIIEQDPRTLGCAFSNWTAPLRGSRIWQQRRDFVWMKAGYVTTSMPMGMTCFGLDFRLPVPIQNTKANGSRSKSCNAERRREKSICTMRMRSRLSLLPTITRCWCKRGHQRKIKTPRKNQKRYGAGLIHWVSGKLYWAGSRTQG
jgi:transposase